MNKIPYTIVNIDPHGTVVFRFGYNGQTYTHGQNFGPLEDKIVQGKSVTANVWLDGCIQEFIQNHIKQYFTASTVPTSVQEMIGKKQGGS